MARFLLIFIATCFSVNLYGQREIDEETSWSVNDRFYTGVGFNGLGFGSSSYYGRYFSIGGGVLGGYMLTKNFSAGVGIDYQYTSYSTYKVKNHLYGGYPFLRYNIKNFFIQTDYGFYNNRIVLPNDQMVDAKAERFFLGGGLFNNSGGRVTMHFLLSYDLLFDSSSYFGSPLNTRVFITF